MNRIIMVASTALVLVLTTASNVSAGSTGFPNYDRASYWLQDFKAFVGKTPQRPNDVDEPCYPNIACGR